jgi:hypothetical protein
LVAAKCGKGCFKLSTFQFLQILGGGLKGFVLFAKAKPDHLRSHSFVVIERRTRNDCDADLADEVFCKLDVVRETKIGDIAHHVIRSVGKVAFETGVLQNRHDKVALFLIFLLQFIVIAWRKSERICTCVLKRIRRADGKKIVYLADG